MKNIRNKRRHGLELEIMNMTKRYSNVLKLIKTESYNAPIRIANRRPQAKHKHVNDTMNGATTALALLKHQAQ